MTAQQPAPASNTFNITLQILSIVFYTFIAFLCIGLPIAVLPSYVHDQLGFGAVIAGVTIGLQYLAPGGWRIPLAASRRSASACWGLPVAGC